MNDEGTPNRTDAQSAHFATTNWSMVLAAGNRKNKESQIALEQLCLTYWPPLYSYVRRRITDTNEAQDLTQAFFERLLEKDYVADADPQRGHFRAFLITAFKNFLSKEWAKAKTLKRGGGHCNIPLDFAVAETQCALDANSGLTAEQSYDKQWAMILLDRVMERLQTEFFTKGKSEHFTELKGYIVGADSETTYAHVAKRLNMTEAAAKKAGSRLRQRYREILRQEISQTVSEPEDIDEEMRNLFIVLGL